MTGKLLMVEGLAVSRYQSLRFQGGMPDGGEPAEFLLFTDRSGGRAQWWAARAHMDQPLARVGGPYDGLAQALTVFGRLYELRGESATADAWTREDAGDGAHPADKRWRQLVEAFFTDNVSPSRRTA